jgi:hypothetical protein
MVTVRESLSCTIVTFEIFGEDAHAANVPAKTVKNSIRFISSVPFNQPWALSPGTPVENHALSPPETIRF